MTRRMSVAMALVGLLLFATSAAAQHPDLSGTWKLDRAASRIDPTVPYSGLGGNAGIPASLYVTQARNGTLIIGSDMNTSHARTYKPGTATAAPLAEGGTAAMASRWDGETLISQGRDAATSTALREALRLASDGETLQVDLAITNAEGEHQSRLVYIRAARESPCKEWPTPCKDW